MIYYLGVSTRSSWSHLLPPHFLPIHNHPHILVSNSNLESIFQNEAFNLRPSCSFPVLCGRRSKRFYRGPWQHQQLPGKLHISKCHVPCMSIFPLCPEWYLLLFLVWSFDVCRKLLLSQAVSRPTIINAPVQARLSRTHWRSVWRTLVLRKMHKVSLSFLKFYCTPLLSGVGLIVLPSRWRTTCGTMWNTRASIVALAVYI